MKRWLTILVNIALIVFCVQVMAMNLSRWEIVALAILGMADCMWDAMQAALS